MRARPNAAVSGRETRRYPPRTSGGGNGVDDLLTRRPVDVTNAGPRLVGVGDDSPRLVGVVRWFSEDKGYGVIAAHAVGEAFVRFSDIVMDGFRSLRPGQHVTFAVDDDAHGTIAVDVRPAS